MSDGQINLEALGLSQDELADRIVNRTVEAILEGGFHYRQNGLYHEVEVGIRDRIEGLVTEKVDEWAESLVEEWMEEGFQEFLDNMIFEETNRWGEPTRPPLSFKEYLAKKAERFVHEKVNYKGQTKGESHHTWKPRASRLAYMIDEHLSTRIQQAVTELFENAHEELAKTLGETASIKLQELSESLRLTVKT